VFVEVGKTEEDLDIMWQVGSGHSAIMLTLSGFIFTPSGVTMNPIKLICCISDLHFDNFR
jgi:hypothetical protein